MAKPIDSAAESHETTADRVWAAAAQLFRERGYAASTTRELAERLGIKKASLYYHVEKKEDLLHGICRESLSRITAAVSKAVSDESDPRLRLVAMIHTHLESMLEDLDLHATMLLELGALTGERKSDILAMRDKYEDIVYRLVRDAQAAKVLRDDIAGKYLLLSLLGMMNWAITWYRPSGKLTPPLLADIVTSVFIDGGAHLPAESLPRSVRRA